MAHEPCDRPSKPLRPAESGRPRDDSGEGTERRLGPLPQGIRLTLFLVGSVLLLIGLVGLALPVVPQTIPLALGIAILSLASEWVHKRLRRLFVRWPSAWRRIQAVRRRLHDWLSRN